MRHVKNESSLREFAHLDYIKQASAISFPVTAPVLRSETGHFGGKIRSRSRSTADITASLRCVNHFKSAVAYKSKTINDNKI